MRASIGRLVPWGLTAAVVAVFGRTVGFEFVNFDDPQFVVDNPHVLAGLSVEGLRWAFSPTDVSQYHPLVWLSYMLDRELWGLQPEPFHAVNVLLHLAAALLLFALLKHITAAPAVSSVVALIFAVHPLRAESVAWVAERKDTLSLVLGLLTLCVYVWYCRRPAAFRLAVVSASFALALLSKPMLVTLPALMLLLDFWPLRRASARPTPERDGRSTWVSLGHLVLEKLPLVALSLGATLVTILVQRHGGALKPLALYPLDLRLRNAASAVWWYVGKLFWPADLAIFYPYDTVPSIAATILADAGIVILSLAAWRVRHRAPAVLVGWSWFLVTLLPVVGLIQSGSQRVADRYSYLPHIGLLIALVFGASAALGAGSRRAKSALLAGALLWSGGLAFAAARQVDTFRDSETLFRHALEVTKNNYMAHNNLASALMERGANTEAEAHFKAAIGILPQWEKPHLGLARLLESQGRLTEAATHYELALRSKPDLAWPHKRLGLIELRLGLREKARERLLRALQLMPGDLEIREALAALE